MKSFSILYWPRKTSDDSEYQLARKAINSLHNVMPEVVTGEIDVMELLEKHPDVILYYPVFCESTGWWGELLGSNAKVTNKVIISSGCQLMAVKCGKAKPQDLT